MTQAALGAAGALSRFCVAELGSTIAVSCRGRLPGVKSEEERGEA